ncbi:hypothetical protein HMPREF3187_01808 [Aerococcus christensenii]|uniref:Uncharacterized protein n=1 Tax=Aerococcus christensenii TaxID=87541 RepID=A0A133XPC7_9LACT|nr:hypothetical protein HMPREF3187_01808 [Aerococcus christensenii]
MYGRYFLRSRLKAFSRFSFNPLLKTPFYAAFVFTILYIKKGEVFSSPFSSRLST